MHSDSYYTWLAIVVFILIECALYNIAITNDYM